MDCLRRRGGAVLGLVAGLLLAVASQAADPHQVEVVGTFPIRESMRGKLDPREEAIQKALWEAVSRVALEQMGEEADPVPVETNPSKSPGQAPGAAPVDPTLRFRKIFGREIMPFTRSFRILEDRGEHPVLFADQPGVRSEYLVVVEVLVDVERVTAELSRAGLVAGKPRGGSREPITIELIGLDQHAGLRRVLDTLRRDLSATHIETLEFSPARQLLRLESPFGPAEFASRLGRLETADLMLDAVEVDPGQRRLRVLAQWFAPSPGEDGAPGETGTRPPSAPRP